MPDEDLTFRLGLQGQAQTEQGLKKTASAVKLVQDAQGRWRAENGRFASSAEKAAAGVELLGVRTRETGARVRQSGASLRGFGADLGFVTSQAKYGAVGLAALAGAGVKWGLATNAQVEQARLRFSLFTDDVEGLTSSVRTLDKNSAFAFADLADAAATLGGAGVKDVPAVLQAVANAAAAGGKGAGGLQAITLALSQIQAKGRLSQEEVNQLTEGGAITAQRDLAKGLGLTAKELQNLGGEGIEASKAIDVLQKAWTSGRMADIAKQQTRTLGGQWNLLTGNAQTAAGAATASLAAGLRDDVLPAANEALTEITKLFGEQGLSNEAKLRQARRIIHRELGPIATDLLAELDRADIPGHLGAAVGAAAPKMAAAAAGAAPEVAKAFVNAWLASGAWVQLASALLLYKKLGAPGLPGKGAGGGALGKLGGKLEPVPVFVTNMGALPGAKPGAPVPTGRPGAKPGIPLRVATTAVKAVPVVAAATGLAAAMHWVLPDSAERAINQDLPSGAGRGSPVGTGTVAPPGFGNSVVGGQPINVNTTLLLDDRVVAKSTHRIGLHEKNRSR